MNNRILIAALVAFFLMAITSAASSNSIAPTTLTVVGLPPGAQMPFRFAPNFTTNTYTSTGYTTPIPVYISNATNTTYSGNIPYQWQGAGTTVTANGTIYTMVSNTYTQIIKRGKNNYLAFYVYLNESLWSANEIAELRAANASLNTAQIILANLQKLHTTVIYNGSTPAGRYANTTQYSAIAKNSSIIFTNVSVVKSPPSCVAMINGQSYSQPGTYSIAKAIVNGHIGFTSQTGYWLNGTLNCNNLNALQTTDRLQFGNGTTIFLSNSLTKTFTQTFSNKVPIGMNVNLMLDANGNANYTTLDPTFTRPTNIIYYGNISVTNPNTITGNQLDLMIPVNTLKYAQYESANLNDMEFFYNNGTVVKSWLEGNAPLTSGGIAQPTGSTPNALSTNTIWWIRYNLGIAGGATNTNTIALGFAGSSNNLLDGVSVGECPTCSASYAQYDNGANVFVTYYDFAGTSLPSGFLSSGTYTVSNGLTVGSSSASGYAITTANYGLNTNQIFDEFLNFQTIASCMNNVGDGYIHATTTTFPTGFYDFYGCAWPPGVNTGASIDGFATDGGSSTNAGLLPVVNGATLISLYWPSTSLATGYVNYTAINSITSGLPSSQVGIGQWDYQGANNRPATIHWMRIRTYPSNGIMPTTAFGPIQATSTYTAPTVTTPIPTNSILDAGQYETINTVITGGTPNYDVIFNVANVFTSTNIPQTNTITQTSSTTPVFTWQATSTDNSNSPIRANVIVTDSNPTTVNSVYSVNIVVNPALLANAPTQSNSVIDIGQFTLQSANPAGGTPNYSYKWYTIGGSSAPVCTSSNVISGATTSTYLASPSTTNSYAYQVTDQASTNTVICSSGDTTNVNVAQKANPPTISNGILINGQFSTLTSHASGGTAPYTISWFTQAGCGGSAVANGINYIVTPSSTTTYTYNIVDSASTPNVLCSPSNSIIVYAAPTTNLYFTGNANGNTIVSGNAIIANDVVTFGSGTFNSIWTVNNIASANGVCGAACSSNIITGATGGAFTYNVVVTDTGTTTPYIIGQETNTIIVSPLSAGIMSVTPTVSQIPQTVNFAATVTGGLLPLKFEFIITNTTDNLITNDVTFSGVTAENYTYLLANSAAIGPQTIKVKITDSLGATVSENNNFFVYGPATKQFGGGGGAGTSGGAPGTTVNVSSTSTSNTLVGCNKFSAATNNTGTSQLQCALYTFYLTENYEMPIILLIVLALVFCGVWLFGDDSYKRPICAADGFAFVVVLALFLATVLFL